MALTPHDQATTNVVRLEPALDARRLEALDRDLILRLERAFSLLRAGAVEAVGRNVWKVRGNRRTYWVGRIAGGRVTCDCPDFVGRQRACKHVCAAILFETLTGGGPQPPAATHPDADGAGAVDLDARVWLTPQGLQACIDIADSQFRRADAALWRHHRRTGHTEHDCAAMRRALYLWNHYCDKLARLLDD
jgi:hypothetical protein